MKESYITGYTHSVLAIEAIGSGNTLSSCQGEEAVPFLTG
jgi:hypothetical protein